MLKEFAQVNNEILLCYLHVLNDIEQCLVVDCIYMYCISVTVEARVVIDVMYCRPNNNFTLCLATLHRSTET